MIAVIADDLTGAAEIAGLGWRHGLRAEILHRDLPPSSADLVVYDSDSRNCRPREAARRVARIARSIRAAKPAWVYRKVDSVLRGNVLAEVRAMQKALGFERTLLAPANPAVGRIIQGGRYFIHGIPINRTDFRNDPVHPRRSAKVVELLGGVGRVRVTLLDPTANVLPAGVVVGEAGTAAAVRHWAQCVDDSTLPSGGADFFSALLQQHGFRVWKSRTQPPRTSRTATLFVSGSMAESSLTFLNRCRARAWPVCLMPDVLCSGLGRARLDREIWAQRIVEAMGESRRVAVGIGQPTLPGPRAGLRLGRILTATIRDVLTRKRPRQVCVEGGATAVLLLQELGWQRLTVDCEFATGVTGVRPVGRRGPLLVLKPGSYAWPDCLCA
jgi:uncharacterized protein YgbK (DUF1537 family)